MSTAWNMHVALNELQVQTCTKITKEIDSLFVNMSELLSFVLQSAETQRHHQYALDSKEAKYKETTVLTENEEVHNFMTGGLDMPVLLGDPEIFGSDIPLNDSQENNVETNSGDTSIFLTNPNIKIEKLDENDFTTLGTYVSNHEPENISGSFDLVKHEEIKFAAPSSSTYQCSKCTFVTEHRTSLCRHMKIVHEGVKKSKVPSSPYQCAKCEFFSSHRSSLNRHLITVHDGVNSYKCEQCKENFPQYSSLLIHRKEFGHFKKSKAPSSLYQCGKCEYFSCHRYNFNRHLMTVHDGVKNYKCKECRENFPQHSSLLIHMKKFGHLKKGCMEVIFR